MSRTYVIPFLGDLDGTTPLPVDFISRQNGRDDVPPLLQGTSKVYYPFGFDPVSGTYAPGREINDLGLIDPVQLWASANAVPGAPSGATPDDFLCNLSIFSSDPDPVATAKFSFTDAIGVLRFDSFQLPLPGPDPRVGTRYGLPIFTGDRFFVQWETLPAVAPGFLCIQLQEVTRWELQDLLCSYLGKPGEGPVDPGCAPPTLDSLTPDPNPIVEPSPGPPLLVPVTLNGTGFMASDTVTVQGPGNIVVQGLTFTSDIALDFTLRLTNASTPGDYLVTVARGDEPGCNASAYLITVDPAP